MAATRVISLTRRCHSVSLVPALPNTAVEVAWLTGAPASVTTPFDDPASTGNTPALALPVVPTLC